MSKTFTLETLKIRMGDADLAPLDLHQRIQRALRALVLDGDLDPGVKLPATRALAQSLGVARDTVENAYVQLQRDGFIARRKGSGSYVSETIGTELRGSARRRALSRERRPASAQSIAPAAGLSRRGRAIFDSGGVADQQSVRPSPRGCPRPAAFRSRSGSACSGRYCGTTAAMCCCMATRKAPSPCAARSPPT